MDKPWSDKPPVIAGVLLQHGGAIQPSEEE
jgi:hypothetical protein